MGIKGLLKHLKAVGQRIHLRELRGKRVGVDAMCWLHRSAYSCAMELALGEPTEKYISFCSSMIDMLVDHGIKPVIVFDGDKLPLKQITRDSRRTRRESNLKLGMEFLNNNEPEKALSYFQRAVSITDDMIERFHTLLRKRNIPYIVAPFEADAQLGFMSRELHIDACISEDSDLFLFGAKRVLYNLDRFGNALEIDIDRVSMASAEQEGVSRPDAAFLRSMARFSEDQVIYAGILAGCDYVDSPPKVGLKTALSIVTANKRPAAILCHLFRHKNQCPSDTVQYEEDFYNAIRMFKHQTVLEPQTGDLRFLCPPESDTESSISMLVPKAAEACRQHFSSLVPKEGQIRFSRSQQSTQAMYSPPSTFLVPSEHIHAPSDLESICELYGLEGSSQCSSSTQRSTSSFSDSQKQEEVSVSWSNRVFDGPRDPSEVMYIEQREGAKRKPAPPQGMSKRVKSEVIPDSQTRLTAFLSN